MFKKLYLFTVKTRWIDQGVSTFFRHITSEPLVIEQRFDQFTRYLF